MSHFRFLTAGESHGQALLVIVEGMPAGLEISEDYIAGHLRRRQQGYGRGKRQQIEVDRAEIISGVRHGKTMGGPIGMRIINRDWENANWQRRMSVAPIEGEVERLTAMRPGHTDLSGTIKYGLDDVRPTLERSSARETTARVAVAAVARRYLEEFGVHVYSHVLAVGEVRSNPPAAIDWQRVEDSPVRCADPEVEAQMIARIDEIKEALDTIGGVFEVRATGVPMGLGSFVQWDRKLDGRIAQAVMSMQAVKGGFVPAAAAGRPGRSWFASIPRLPEKVEHVILVPPLRLFRSIPGGELVAEPGPPLLLRLRRMADGARLDPVRTRTREFPLKHYIQLRVLALDLLLDEIWAKARQ